MPAIGRARPERARALFLSDIHLGYRHSRVRELIDFLRRIEAEYIVLVGDIVDGLSLAKRFFWATEHTEVLRLLLARRRAGTRIVYLPGNHDAGLAILADMLHGQLEVRREWVHKTARGQRLLVMHGDQFDEAVACPAWLYWLGDALYTGTLIANHSLNNLRRRLGWTYLPVAERIKLSIGTSARYIERYERIAAAHALAQGYDGIVCGHIHRARLCSIDGSIYANTGDWVESCSALVERLDGELELRRFHHGAASRIEPVPLLADAA